MRIACSLPKRTRRIRPISVGAATPPSAVLVALTTPSPEMVMRCEPCGTVIGRLFSWEQRIAVAGHDLAVGVEMEDAGAGEHLLARVAQHHVALAVQRDVELVAGLDQRPVRVSRTLPTSWTKEVLSRWPIEPVRARYS
ncbi:MAG: hypothetical protein WDO24_01965 [Pseudomonadota bacterium]